VLTVAWLTCSLFRRHQFSLYLYRHLQNQFQQWCR
jgi:hypothetical protein